MPWLDNLLHTIGGSPLFLSVGALILFIFLLSAIMRVAKLALFAGLLLVVYIGYLQYSGGAVPREVRTAEQVIEQSARDAGRALKNNAQTAGEAVRTAAEKVGERLEQGFSGPAQAAHDALTQTDITTSGPAPVAAAQSEESRPKPR